MKDTKQRILDIAIALFNEKGVNNVTLRDIASALDISTGNLAYHYKNKDFIIEEAFGQMEAERDRVLAGVQQIPSFEDINAQLLPILQITEKYRFIYLDTIHLIRTYPNIAQLHRKNVEHSIKYIKAVFDISVGSGSIRPEEEEGQYFRLANTIWMIMNFWLEKMILQNRQELQIDEVRKSIWDLVIPLLTEKGKHRFQEIYASIQ